MIDEGNALLFALALDCGELKKKEFVDFCKAKGLKAPKFSIDYEPWYSSARAVISILLPDRLSDFSALYKNEKRKEINFLTYSISDAVLGLRTTRGWQDEEVASQRAAIPKLQQQVSILSSVSDRLSRKITDLKNVLQADIFSDELDAAEALRKAGHLRAAGAISGVVLERHLRDIAGHHGFKSRKKHPSISEFNEFLKANDIIDTAIWRRVQYLGDVRNLCDHPKDREPTNEEIVSIISGTKEIVATII